MKQKVVFSVIVLITLLLTVTSTALAWGLMARSHRQLTPKPGMALIVFVHQLTIVNQIPANIFDVSTERTEFIGSLKNFDKCCYDVAPGPHVFMVVGESADFMKANLKAGRVYYATINTRLGAFKERYSFRPLRRSDLTSDRYAGWIAKSSLIEKKPAGDRWAKRRARSIEKKRARYWEAWCKLSPELRHSMTLYPEDGVKPQ